MDRHVGGVFGAQGKVAFTFPPGFRLHTLMVTNEEPE
jgi:hypothetical protein